MHYFLWCYRHRRTRKHSASLRTIPHIVVGLISHDPDAFPPSLSVGAEVHFAALDSETTPRQTTLLNHCIRLLQRTPSTIRDLRALLKNKSLPATYDTANLSQSSREFFQDEFSAKTYAETKEQLVWRLDRLLESTLVQEVFCVDNSGFDMQEVMRGKVLLIDTSVEDFGEQGSGFIGRYFLAALTIAAQQRKDNHPCYVYVDEAGSYMTPNISTILERCREANVGLTIAHQQLDQLGTLASTVMTNTATKFVGAVPDDAERFAKIMRVESERLRHQPDLHFYLKAFAHPIELRIDPLIASYARPSRVIEPQKEPQMEKSTPRDSDSFEEDAW